MMNLQKYTKYEQLNGGKSRLFPKLRVSHSLYRYWYGNRWDDIWTYLLRLPVISTRAQEVGKRVHSYLETHGIPPSLERRIERLDGEIILDYKTGSMSGYEKQLQSYFFGIQEMKSRGMEMPTTPQSEFKYEIDFGDFDVVGVIDYYLPKAGAESFGILAKIVPIYDKNGDIEMVGEVATHSYRFNESDCSVWGNIYDEVANDIMTHIDAGYLDKFIKTFIL
jgi:hypothetical protein